jgi:putative phosphoribosyl transferase
MNTRSGQPEVTVQASSVDLGGFLELPDACEGVVVFVHGSGSSRFSARNQYVAQVLNDAGFGTLLFDLLTLQEQHIDQVTAQLRFDIPLLAGRLGEALQWLVRQPQLTGQPVGLFGASTGAAAALMVAAEQPELVRAVVSRGGRPDLAGDALPRVRAPTLLVVGSNDFPVLALNQEAAEQLGGEVRLEVIPGASHLFEEPHKLEDVARLATAWFQRTLR